MSSNNESIKKTLLVAVLLCIACSLVVSTAAVVLKPAQKYNQELDRKKNILAAAGLLNAEQSIEEQYKQVTEKVVNLETGEYTDRFEGQRFNQMKLTRDEELSIDLQNDPAGIGRRENFAEVYLVQKDGELDKIILPVRGYGLWSTLYGFLALEADANTIAGLGFYQHGETPGLGGEVDNPKWKAQWVGKEVYKDGEVEIELVKGGVDPQRPGSEYKVDALSGATLTSNGVTYLLQFWLGERGYKEFLQNVRSGEA